MVLSFIEEVGLMLHIQALPQLAEWIPTIPSIVRHLLTLKEIEAVSAAVITQREVLIVMVVMFAKALSVLTVAASVWVETLLGVANE